MTPRSFWAILIKILGIYIILESITSIPGYLASMYSFAMAFRYPGNSEGNFSTFFGVTIYTISIIVIYGLVLYYSIFKTDWIIDKLKLDKGLEDERLEFNIHRSTILKIIIVVMGGLLLVEGLPRLFSDILGYAQAVKNYNKITYAPEAKYILFTSVQIFIGYFMLTCSRMIVNFIERQRRGTVADISDK